MDIDTTYVKKIQADPNYDFLESLKIKEEEVNNIPDYDGSGSWMDSLDTFIREHELFFKIVWALILVAIVAYIIRLIILKYNKKVKDDDEQEQGLGNDTIEGHDWKKEMAEYMAQGKYDEVVVLCYLHWLSALNEDGVIVFRQSKTPGMLLDEVKSKRKKTDTDQSHDERVSKTSTLTYHYLRIRYGHRSVDAALANKILEL